MLTFVFHFFRSGSESGSETGTGSRIYSGSGSAKAKSCSSGSTTQTSSHQASFKLSILVRRIRIRIQTYCTMYRLHLMDPDRIRRDIQKVRAFKQNKTKKYVKICQYRTVYSMPYCFSSFSLRKN
jgi:hypothetical protein